MKKLNIFLLLAFAALASCSHDRSMEGRYDANDPGYEYAPEGDMYHGTAYEPLSQYEAGQEDIRTIDHGTNTLNPHAMNMREPDTRTVARGQQDYHFPYKNTPEDYNRAGSATNPVANNAANLAEGKKLYEAYCWQCHGKEETPKGSMVSAGKYPPPTWDFERKGLLNTLPAGRMFFSITYGRNLMGPHGPLLTPAERWMIVHYLQNLSGVKANAAPADTASTAAIQPNTK